MKSKFKLLFQKSFVPTFDCQYRVFLRVQTSATHETKGDNHMTQLTHIINEVAIKYSILKTPL